MSDRSKHVQLFLAAIACGLALAACGGVGGAAPGTATVIGHRPTPRASRPIEKQQAGYAPVVSDGRRRFLIGYHELIGLDPAKR